MAVLIFFLALSQWRRYDIMYSHRTFYCFQLGPRLCLQLIKIQEGMCSGEVLFHEFGEDWQFFRNLSCLYGRISLVGRALDCRAGGCGINGPFAWWRHFTTMTRILQGFAFLCKLGLLLFKTSQGLPNLNMKRKPKRILVVVVKWRHRAIGLFPSQNNTRC